MGWFTKKQDHSEITNARKELNDKLDKFHRLYDVKIEKEDTPTLEIIPIDNCWLEVLDGVQVIDPNFPYFKNKDTMIIINAKKGVTIGPHKHVEDEVIHIITGSYKEVVKGDVEKQNSTVKYPSLTGHGITFLEDSILLVHWKNKQQ